MEKVKGKELMLRIGDKTIALATRCSIDYEAQMIDARVKLDSGAHDIVDFIKFSISSENLVGVSQNSVTYKILADAMRQKLRIDVSTMLAHNAAGSIPAGGWIPAAVENEKGYSSIKGKAIITRLSVNGPTRGYATMSVTLAGQGSIAPTNYEKKVTAEVVGTTLVVSGHVAVVGTKLKL